MGFGLNLDRAEAPGDRIGRLQAVDPDEEDDAVRLVDLAARDRLAEGAERDAGGRFAEDARRLGEERQLLAHVVLRDRVDRAAGASRGRDGEVAVGRVSDRERARDRARADGRDAPALREGPRDGRASFRPAEEPGRRSRDEAEVGESDRVVLLVTGDGLKTPDPVAERLRPVEIEADADAVLDRLGATVRA